MDAAIRKQYTASNLRITGWELLVFDCIPVVFIWVGFRVGSYLWLWWSLIEALLGIGLVRIGGNLDQKALREYAEAAKETSTEAVVKVEGRALRAA